MLNKMLKINLRVIGIIVLILIIVQLITSFIFGYIAERQLAIQFKHYTDSALIEVVSHKYSRGLFSSEETAEIAVNSKVIANIVKILPKVDNQNQPKPIENQKYSIKYTTHIEHGLFAGIMNGNFIPSIAYAKTSVTFPPNLQNLLEKFFTNKTPLTIINTIYLNKAGKFNIFSNPFNYEEAVSGVKVVWGGLDLVIKYNNKFNQFENKLLIPLFSLIAPTKGMLVFHDLVYQANTRLSTNKIKVGNTNLKLKGINLEWHDKMPLNFNLGDALNMLTGISSTEFLNNIDAIDPNAFRLTNISYVSTSSDDGKFFDANSNIKFESLFNRGNIYGPMDLNISIGHILSQDFSHLIDSMQQLSLNSQNTKEDVKEKLVNALKVNFIPILIAEPFIKLNKFELYTPSGLIKLSGLVTAKDFTANDIEDQQKFMRKLIIDINFIVPKPIISYLFVLQMKYLLSAGNAKLDQQSSDTLTKVVNILLESQIDTWVKKNYIKKVNNSLQSHIVYKQGMLWLNENRSK